MSFLRKYAVSAIRGRIEQRIASVRARVDQISLPQRFQGTVIERWAKYWKWLAIDYSSVVFGVLKDAQRRPVRTMVLAASCATIYKCAELNPTETDYRNELQFFKNEMTSLPENMQRTTSKAYLEWIESLQVAGRIRRINLGVASVFWQTDSNPELMTYKALCPYVAPEWTSLPGHLIEIGFWNRFWTLSSRMHNYDVNE